MNLFVWALAGFVIIHVGISATGLRSWLVGRVGEGAYRGLFSLASGVLLTALIFGIVQMRADPFDPLNVPLWTPPEWARWGAYVLVLVGVSLAFAGVFTPGPTLAGFEKRGLARPEPAYGVLRITRHPFLWGVAIWGAGHLLANGERFAIMLFGALALMAVLGTRSIDRKGAARDPEGWAKFEAVSSNVPFLAILQGRNRLVIGEIGWRALVGVAIAVAIALFHQQLFGVAAFST